jgi:hypothetical protein
VESRRQIESLAPELQRINRMKARVLSSIALLVFSTAAFAGGNTEKRGAPDETWLGDSNTDEYQRSLVVKCPADTTPGSVEAIPDDQGTVIVVECNYTN